MDRRIIWILYEQNQRKVFFFFLNEILKINYLYEYNSYNNEESLFFINDKNMLLHHEDICYNPRY